MVLGKVRALIGRGSAPENPIMRRVKSHFDAEFYASQLDDPPTSAEALLQHYLEHGWKEGLDPSASFCASSYLQANPDVRSSGVEPLTHYLSSGEAEGRVAFSLADTEITASGSDWLNEIELIEAQFDRNFYLLTNDDVFASGIDPVLHYVQGGWREGRDPAPWFSSEAYIKTSGLNLDGDENPLGHYLRDRPEGALTVEPSTRMVVSDDVRRSLEPYFDAAFYRRQARKEGDLSIDPFIHFMLIGWRKGLDPSPGFSIQAYLKLHEDIAETDKHPLWHFVERGREECRLAPSSMQQIDIDEAELRAARWRASIIADEFDAAFYTASNADVRRRKADPLTHYVLEGWRLGYDPSPEFSIAQYLRENPDVGEAGVEPFSHYLTLGRNEGREARPVGDKREVGVSVAANVFEQQSLAVSKSRHFEQPRPDLFNPAKAQAKVLAFYLPQFHPFKENNEWWGEGFTEWTNLARAMPRFEGHRQPRIPRDTGFYDLRMVDTLRAQARMARDFGVYGFATYYYFFNGKRLMETPIDLLLANPDIDLPFCLIWANENWTRTWDGFDRDVLIAQDYRPEDEDKLLEDWMRHFRDKRYIRVSGRPLIVIYRPGIIPEAKKQLARWRKKLKSEYGENPFFLMVQAFGDYDPRKYGFDGAIEFPPHKLLADQPTVNSTKTIFDPAYSGNIFDYSTLADLARAEPEPDFPLVRTVTLEWDNDARRPGASMSISGFTPELYEDWLRDTIDFAAANPIDGEAFVGVNAWNEWAEGVYLEPDTHYGHALLNATARALGDRAPTHKLLLIGHDAYRHGAQVLLYKIAETLRNDFGFEVRTLILGAGPMLDEYADLGECVSVNSADEAAVTAAVEQARHAGFTSAVMNTTVSGAAARALNRSGIRFISLVHELPRLIGEYKLESQAEDIARYAAEIVFPGRMVRDGFLKISGKPSGAVSLQPQGLFNSVIDGPSADSAAKIRKKHGLPADTKLVINVAYGDWRKGFDLFAQTAAQVLRERDDVAFIWVGNVVPDVERWLMADFSCGKASKRFIVTDYVTDLPPYYEGADAFFLSSREDPFPSVVLEAMAAGLPLVGFEGHGDCAPLIKRHGQLVAFGDVSAAAQAIVSLLDRDKTVAGKASDAARRAVASNHRFDDYCFDLARRLEPSLKTVSVVVPNFNYEDHIEERLISIFKQTYPVREIIVLDDKSTDASIKRIEAVAERFGRTIDLVVNDTNSGSVFKQWKKGALKAKGDYLWIAEADDTADPEFLKSLMDIIGRDDEVSLAFSDSWQMDPDNKKLGGSYKPYVGAYSGETFDATFVSPASDFLSRHLAVRNVILNVSSVVWRREPLVKALKSVGDDLFEYKVAGDWRLYSELLLQGGKVAYCSQALNGHRRHATSVTHALNKERHLDEVKSLQTFISSKVEVTAQTRKKIDAALEEVTRHLKIGHKTTGRTNSAGARAKRLSTKTSGTGKQAATTVATDRGLGSTKEASGAPVAKPKKTGGAKGGRNASRRPSGKGGSTDAN